METIRIAVGSKRAPKLEAVREALKAFGPMLHPNASFEVTGCEVATGVRHTLLSRSELMAGARGRCEALMRLADEGNGPAYFVGLEGGLDVIHENGHENGREDGRRLAFLQSWAFAADGGGRGFYGQSGAILLPEALAAEVLDRGTELSRDRSIYRNAGYPRFARRLGRIDQGPDRPAGVVSDRRDQRVRSLLQRGALSEKRDIAVKSFLRVELGVAIPAHKSERRFSPVFGVGGLHLRHVGCYEPTIRVTFR
jgi:non-canonical (house-cleaning) NTP pyrophosphatase